MIAALIASALVVPACGARDIRAFDGMLQGATGTMDGSVYLRNVSSVRCRLGGRPAVRIRARDGRILSTKQEALIGVGRRTITVLAPRRVAVLHLDWTNWCGTWSGTFTTVRLELMLSTRRTLGAPIRTGRPRCDSHSSPSRLFVSQFVAP